MISVETYMADNEASAPENLPGEWIRLMKGQELHLPLIADF
jgi:hypothetical protein